MIQTYSYWEITEIRNPEKIELLKQYLSTTATLKFIFLKICPSKKFPTLQHYLYIRNYYFLINQSSNFPAKLYVSNHSLLLLFQQQLFIRGHIIICT